MKETTSEGASPSAVERVLPTKKGLTQSMLTEGESNEPLRGTGTSFELKCILACLVAFVAVSFCIATSVAVKNPSVRSYVFISGLIGLLIGIWKELRAERQVELIQDPSKRDDVRREIAHSLINSNVKVALSSLRGKFERLPGNSDQVNHR